MNEQPSRFGKFLQKATSPESMAFGWLPLAGVIESIASRGQSPGTSALQQQKIVLGGMEQREQEAERKRKLAEEARKKVLIEQYGEQLPEDKKGLYSLAPEKYIEKEMESTFQKPSVPLTSAELEFLKSTEPYEQQYAITNPEAWRKTRTGAVLRPVETPEQKAAREKEESDRRLQNAKEMARYEDELRRKQKEFDLSNLQGPVQERAQTALEALSRIAVIEKHPGLSGAVGMKSAAQGYGMLPTPIAGTPEAGFMAQFDGLKSLLTLENIGKLKGVLSDTDMRILTNAATALNTNMAESEFIGELTKVKHLLSRVSAGLPKYDTKQRPRQPDMISNQMDFPSREAAAQAAQSGKIPVGTEIYINGVKSGVMR